MCAGALVNARIGRVVYGATDPKAGAVASLYEVCGDPRLNHRPPVDGGVRADECGACCEILRQPPQLALVGRPPERAEVR